METVNENPLRLLKIEEELAGPEADAAVRKYDAELLEIDARLKSEMNRGLAPEDFAKAEELKEAVLIARKLIRLAAQK